MTFAYKALALATLSGLAMTAHGAGLDRSGQDITAFLQDGTYGEVVYTYVDADVSGTDNAGRNTGNMSETYDFGRFGVKADINDTFSVGVIYDEPFGAAVQYSGTNNFVSEGAAATALAFQNSDSAKALREGIAKLTDGIAQTEGAGQDATALKAQLRATQELAAKSAAVATSTAMTAEAQKGEGTNVEIRTQNATMLLGAKLGQNKNFQIYGGPAMQRLTGELHLRGTAYSALGGYDATLGANMGYGWVAGVAYHKPEIALRASLTYRSEIDHKHAMGETVPATAYHGVRDFEVTLPESWNLDFQTGVSPTMLLTAKVRYVPWGDFSITPPQYFDTLKGLRGQGYPVVSYSDDQWSGELGLAKKLSDKWVVSGNVGYDSGAGNPISTLGPVEGYYSVGLGARYNVTPEWSVSAGAKYLKFGDATAQLPTGDKVGEFKDNDGYIVGVKLAYQKK